MTLECQACGVGNLLGIDCLLTLVSADLLVGTGRRWDHSISLRFFIKDVILASCLCSLFLFTLSLSLLPPLLCALVVLILFLILIGFLGSPASVVNRHFFFLGCLLCADDVTGTDALQALIHVAHLRRSELTTACNLLNFFIQEANVDVFRLEVCMNYLTDTMQVIETLQALPSHDSY